MTFSNDILTTYDVIRHTRIVIRGCGVKAIKILDTHNDDASVCVSEDTDILADQNVLELRRPLAVGVAHQTSAVGQIDQRMVCGSDCVCLGPVIYSNSQVYFNV